MKASEIELLVNEYDNLPETGKSRWQNFWKKLRFEKSKSKPIVDKLKSFTQTELFKGRAEDDLSISLSYFLEDADLILDMNRDDPAIKIIFLPWLRADEKEHRERHEIQIKRLQDEAQSFYSDRSDDHNSDYEHEESGLLALAGALPPPNDLYWRYGCLEDLAKNGLADEKPDNSSELSLSS